MFSDPAHYDIIGPKDTIDILGLTTFTPGKSLTLRIHKPDNSTLDIAVNHTFNEAQIGWFKAGSALNQMADEAKNPQAF